MGERGNLGGRAAQVCRCGHRRPAHVHYRAGDDCAFCGQEICPRFRSASSPLWRVRRRIRLWLTSGLRFWPSLPGVQQCAPGARHAIRRTPGVWPAAVLAPGWVKLVWIASGSGFGHR